MKVLKIILFLVVVLVLLVTVLSFLGPKDYQVERSIQIDADRAIVYRNVAFLEAQSEWGPWKEQEPDMVTTIKGEDGVVGSFSHWKSSKSEGEQKLVHLVENERVETELKFINMGSEAKGYFNLADGEGGATETTWGFKGDYDFIGRAMAMLGMDMDSFVGDSFEKGLSNLKARCEDFAKEQAEAKKNMVVNGYSFGVVEREAMSFLVKRQEVKIESMGEFYAQHFPALSTALAVAEVQPTGMPCGLFYSWDQENGVTDMCAAVPIADANLRIEGYETITLEPGKVVKVTHLGPYETSEDAHYAMDDYIKANGLEQNGPVMEQYVNDPSTVSPEEIKTDIYYAVK